MKEFLVFAAAASITHGLAFAYGLSLGLSTVRKWRRDWAWVEVETPVDVRAAAAAHSYAAKVIEHGNADWLL